MPSWQSRAVTFALKALMKRHEVSDEVARTRAVIRRTERLLAYPRKGVRVRTAASAPVPAEWIEPVAAAPTRTLVYLHGGAYIFCSARTHRGLASYLARKTPARVLVPDYRLAPEHPFPAALEDALSCVRWLVRQGVAPADLVMAGDSAGGGLALAVMLALREAGEPLPGGAALIAPWTDLAATGTSVQANSETDAWVYGETVALGATLYLGTCAATHPLASPHYADLKGLPSLLVHVSDAEVLLDDSVRLAEKARAAGVSVQLKVWKGLPHVWQGFVPFIPEARRSLDEIAAFLARPA